jgi:Ca-activated chloride channel family protein
MTVLAPEHLLGLLAIPVLLGFYAWAQRRRTRYAVRFTNLDLLANLAPRRPAWRRHVPPALYLAAVAVLLVAMARPTMVVPEAREDATVVLVMDVSGSMNAVDVDPTRLAAAKAAARSFLDQLPEGIRVGLVAFSSEPRRVVEPTTDREFFLEALDRLTAVGGTAMGDAIDEAVQIADEVREGAQPDATPEPSGDPSSEPAPGASDPAGSPDPGASPDPETEAEPEQLVATILLSDGANSVGDATPIDAAGRAAEAGMPIYTIALGTDDGEVTVPGPFGIPQRLPVPPDTATLERVAEITGGAAFDAPTAADLASVYDALESRIGFIDVTQEVTAWLAAGALVLVVIGGGAAILWFGRLP